MEIEISMCDAVSEPLERELPAAVVEDNDDSLKKTDATTEAPKSMEIDSENLGGDSEEQDIENVEPEDPDEAEKQDKEEKDGEQSKKVGLFPLARIRAIAKADPENTSMIIARPALVQISVATEMFVRELSRVAEAQRAKTKRRTLKEVDVFTAIEQRDVFAFLDGVFD